MAFELFLSSGGTDLALVDEMGESLLTISGGVFGDSLALEEALTLKRVVVDVVCGTVCRDLVSVLCCCCC